MSGLNAAVGKGRVAHLTMVDDPPVGAGGWPWLAVCGAEVHTVYCGGVKPDMADQARLRPCPACSRVGAC